MVSGSTGLAPDVVVASGKQHGQADAERDDRFDEKLSLPFPVVRLLRLPLHLFQLRLHGGLLLLLLAYYYFHCSLNNKV